MNVQTVNLGEIVRRHVRVVYQVCVIQLMDYVIIQLLASLVIYMENTAIQNVLMVILGAIVRKFVKAVFQQSVILFMDYVITRHHVALVMYTENTAINHVVKVFTVVTV